MTIIKSDKIINGGDIFDGFIIVENGKIKGLENRFEGEYTDHTGDFISPGFIDIHTHGAGGHDFMDGTANALEEACKAHLAHGTTTILPTSVACSDVELYRFIDNFKEAKNHLSGCMNLHGVHLEGPYFNTVQAGAQDPAYITEPDEEQYRNIISYADGAIKRWSVAAELKGADVMGEYLTKRGILASVGHSDAEYEDMVRAIKSGYNLLTHFYSGMSTIKRRNGYRKLGLIECGYLFDELYVEIIADGHHLPPELLRLICKLKNNSKIILVTDSMRAAGLPDGEYIIGSLTNGQRVISENGVAKLPDRTAFAGSTATADRLVRVMRDSAGLDIISAVKMITENPAKLLGIDGKKGSFRIGCDFDAAVFDVKIDIKAVYTLGRCQV